MSMRQFVTFRVDGRLLGLDIKSVREINRALDITLLHQDQAHIRGLVNLRGQVVVIFDLAVCLGWAPRPITDHSHNVLIKNEDVALLVDEIGDVVEAAEEDLAPPPANLGEIASEYVQSVVKLQDDLLVVLAVDRILG